MARRLADGEMYRLVFNPGHPMQEIFGPYDKLSTARGVASNKISRDFGGYRYKDHQWVIEKAVTQWEEVTTSYD